MSTEPTRRSTGARSNATTIPGVKRGLPATIESKVTGARITFLEQGTDDDGEFLRGEAVEQAGARGPPVHVHPDREERFEIPGGRIIYELDGAERVEIAGERVVVPGSSVHHPERRRRDLGILTEIRPPGEMESVLRTIYHFRDDDRLTAVPWVVQEPLLRVGAAVAERIGYRPTSPEFTGDE